MPISLDGNRLCTPHFHLESTSTKYMKVHLFLMACVLSSLEGHEHGFLRRGRPSFSKVLCMEQ